MKWIDHDRWAQKYTEWCQKMRLPDEISIYVSNYINRAIDNINMPKDFEKHTSEKKIPVVKHGNMSIDELAPKLHDRDRNRIVIQEDLNFLSKKGEDYVKAYYLHFILDYLVNLNKNDWMKNTGESIEQCIDKFKKNKAVILPETEEQLQKVMIFLKNNAYELKQDIDHLYSRTNS